MWSGHRDGGRLGIAVANGVRDAAMAVEGVARATLLGQRFDPRVPARLTSRARSARRRATTIPPPRRTGLFPTADGPCRSPSAAKGRGSASVLGSPENRTHPEWPPPQNASNTASSSTRWWRRPSALGKPTNCWPNSTASACPPDASAASTRSTRGSDPLPGLLVDVDHDTLGPITLPGPPLRFCHLGRRRNHPHRHHAVSV